MSLQRPRLMAGVPVAAVGLRSIPPTLAAAAVLVVAAAVRLLLINQPYVDAWAWRQTDVASIARNFLLHGFRVFYPQIDWGGGGPGYVGTEFPLVPLLAAIGYIPFGEQPWIGRAISILFFLLCTPFLYLLVRDLYNQRTGLFALVFFCFSPLVLVASRSFTSDMAALSLAVISLYLFRRWMEEDRSVARFAAVLSVTTLALLTKIPYAIFGVPMLAMAWGRYGRGVFRVARLWIFGLATLGIPALWYGHAYLISVNHFPYHIFGHGMLRPADADTYVLILLRTFGWSRQYALFSALTPLLSALMVFGLFLRPSGRFRWTLHWLFAASVLFLILAGMGSRFPAYQLSFAVVAAGFAGAALDALLAGIARRTSPLAVRGVALAVFGSYFALVHVFVRSSYDSWATSYLRAGAALDRIAPIDALIVVASNLEPMLFYFSQRKGWSFDDTPGSFDPATPEQAEKALIVYRDLGARYFVTTRETTEFFSNHQFRAWMQSRWTVVSDTDDYYIVELDSARRQGDG